MEFSLFAFLFLFSSSLAETADEFLTRRRNSLRSEVNMRLGGDEKLNADELRVNEFLMKLKDAEFSVAAEPRGKFWPAEHFFRARPYIDESPIFKIIKRMPKGAALHVHDMAFGDLEFLIRNVTHDPNCFMCFDDSKELNFKFFSSTPSSECKWTSVEKKRQASSDPQVFDQMLLNNVTMLVDDPEKAYPSQSAAWKRFLSTFKALNGLVFYGPVVKDYVRRAMVSMIEDNVQYVEMRSVFSQVYEADGSVHDMNWLVEALQEVNVQLLKEYPQDFTGYKVIYTSNRAATKDVIRQGINTTLQLRAKYQNFVVGYDLVAHEDPGFTLLHFLDELLYPSQIGQDLPFFFHAGETDWYGQSPDVNILDALLLNTSRIGHGYAITKHPWAMKEAKERDIPLEVNPISNQVLKFVDDLRNHPAANLMAIDFPMVISADDPSLWGVSGLSYDFYAAFMALGGAWADLGTLKKLAKNSIKYSAMSDEEKTHTMLIWEKKWVKFINEINRNGIFQ